MRLFRQQFADGVKKVPYLCNWLESHLKKKMRAVHSVNSSFGLVQIQYNFQTKSPDMLQLSQHTSNTLANLFYFCSSNCRFILLFWKMTFLLLWGNGDELETCVWEIVNENNFFPFFCNWCRKTVHRLL